MRTLALPIVLIAAIGLGACSQTTQRVGGGAAIGAGVGAVGTAITASLRSSCATRASSAVSRRSTCPKWTSPE